MFNRVRSLFVFCFKHRKAKKFLLRWKFLSSKFLNWIHWFWNLHLTPETYVSPGYKRCFQCNKAKTSISAVISVTFNVWSVTEILTSLNRKGRFFFYYQRRATALLVRSTQRITLTPRIIFCLFVFLTDEQVRPNMCSIRNLDGSIFVLTSIIAFLFCIFVFFNISRHFARFKVKTPHFCRSSSVPPSHKRTYRLDGMSDLEIWRLVFRLEVSWLPVLLLCMFGLRDYFYGLRLKCLISTAVPQYKRTYYSDGVRDLGIWRLVFFKPFMRNVVYVDRMCVRPPRKYDYVDYVCSICHR